MENKVIAVIVGFIQVPFVMPGYFKNLHQIKQASDIVSDDRATSMVDQIGFVVEVAGQLAVRGAVHETKGS
jgi:hypothetical protein